MLLLFDNLRTAPPSLSITLTTITTIPNTVQQWGSVGDLTTHGFLVYVSMTSSCSVNGGTICW